MPTTAQLGKPYQGNTSGQPPKWQDACKLAFRPEYHEKGTGDPRKIAVQYDNCGSRKNSCTTDAPWQQFHEDTFWSGNITYLASSPSSEAGGYPFHPDTLLMESVPYHRQPLSSEVIETGANLETRSYSKILGPLVRIRPRSDIIEHIEHLGR